MKSSTKWAAVSGIVLAAGLFAGAAHADDAALIDNRQSTMKAQGKDMTAIKAYLDDKADLASAQTAGADLVKQVGKIPDLFPKGTGMAEYQGKSWAKPAVWTEADKFACTRTPSNRSSLWAMVATSVLAPWLNQVGSVMLKVPAGLPAVTNAAVTSGLAITHAAA